MSGTAPVFTSMHSASADGALTSAAAKTLRSSGNTMPPDSEPMLMKVISVVALISSEEREKDVEREVISSSFSSLWLTVHVTSVFLSSTMKHVISSVSCM